LTIVGAGERDGSIDGHSGVVGRKVKPLAYLVVGVFVDLAPATGLEVLSDVERKLYGLTKPVGHTVQPLGLAIGGFCYLHDDALSFLHGAIIEQVFDLTK
jgi:hypothetical protein